MINLINQNQVVENRVTGNGPESQISKVRLTGATKGKGEQEIVYLPGSQCPGKDIA